jgi:hypothetical protein
MLSINYLSNFLEVNQIKISNFYYDKINNFERKNNTYDTNSINIANDIPLNVKTFKDANINKFNVKLTESFDILFNKSITNFYYYNKTYKNQSYIFTFINSILNIIDETFDLYDINEKEKIIKDFIILIDSDLFKNDLYTKFNYIKNRKFNKLDIQTVLKNAIQFKYCDKFHLLKEYISDYLGINIYIIKMNNNFIDFTNCEYYLTKYYNNNYSKYVPNLIIIEDNGIYKPILKYKLEEEKQDSNLASSSVLTYSENKNIIDNLWNYLKIDETNNNKPKEYLVTNDKTIDVKNSKYSIDFLNNLKIDAIKKLCTDNNILLQKKSEKTSKMINKLKNELINDLYLITDI